LILVDIVESQEFFIGDEFVAIINMLATHVNMTLVLNAMRIVKNNFEFFLKRKYYQVQLVI